MKHNMSIKYQVVTSRKVIILEIICCLLIILFFYTGLSKLIEFNGFEFDLINAPVIRKLTPVVPIIKVVVPIAELLTAVLLVVPRTRMIGLYSSLTLMVMFTIYVGGILSFAKDKMCTCGGVLRSMSWEQHLLFNIFFSLLAFVGVVLHKKFVHGK